jgi:hypothetical protein
MPEALLIASPHLLHLDALSERFAWRLFYLPRVIYAHQASAKRQRQRWQRRNGIVVLKSIQQEPGRWRQEPEKWINRNSQARTAKHESTSRSFHVEQGGLGGRRICRKEKRHNMASHQPQHTGHELSRSRGHEGDRMAKDKGGHQSGHDKPPGSVDMQKLLKVVNFPTTRKAILEEAASVHVNGKMMNALRKIPDLECDTPAAIANEIGKTF